MANSEEDFFETKVFPDLQKALVQLTEHIIKSDEVRKHKEKLKELRVLDKLEQKNQEKEKLREELGSDYESSSDSSVFEELDFAKSESFEEKLSESAEGTHNNSQIRVSFAESNEKNKIDKKRVTQLLLKKKEEKIFNPLQFLGKLLKDSAQKLNERPLSVKDLHKSKKKTVKIIEEPEITESYQEQDDISP